MVTSNLFFFFLSRNSLGVHYDWDVNCSTIDFVVAFKASGTDCAMSKKAGVFGAHSVQGHRRWGRPRQGLLGALEKKTWAWGMSPNLKFHTPANPQTCTEQTHESNRMFLDEPWRLSHCFQSSCLLPLSFVIHGKVSLWLAVDRFWWHLSIPQRRNWKCIRRPSTFPVSQGTGGSLFPSRSVRATRSDTVSVRLGNVKLGLDSEKRKPTSYHWSLNREKTFGRRNALHSFHCMHYVLNVSRAFRCPPPFCARTFDE